MNKYVLTLNETSSCNEVDTEFGSKTMKTLYIIRGASGSGKSTLANKLLEQNPKGAYFEADHFFLVYDPYSPTLITYKFDSTKLGQAHKCCQETVFNNMSIGVSPIIVSNTNTRLKELEPYLDLAEKFGYQVVIYKTKGPWDPEVLFKRNVHNVPLEIIKKQVARYEPHEDEKEYEA